MATFDRSIELDPMLRELVKIRASRSTVVRIA
jgi:hypothetical protein